MNISKLTKGEAVNSFYLLRNLQKKMASNGNAYFQLTLSDRTGSIEARLFDVASLFDSPDAYQPGTVVKVLGGVEEFNGKLNIKLGKARLARPAETEEHLPLLIRRSVRPPTEIREDLESYIEDLRINFPLESFLCHAILESLSAARWERAAAAAKLHHAYLGGYLEHVLSLVEVSQIVAGHYGLDQGTMTAIAFCHDVGKLEELVEVNGVIEYSRSGILFGHIAMGYSLVGQWASFAMKKAIEHGMTEETADQRIEAILHGILSHHGELAHGSPVLPATREALAFHFIDNLDSKMAIEAEAWESVHPDALIHPERHFKLGVRLVRYPHSIRMRSTEQQTQGQDGAGHA